MIMAEYYVGIDFGGTNTKVGLFSSDIELITKTSVPTGHDEGADAVLDMMATAVKQIVADSDIAMDDVKGVGLASPGPASYKRGVLGNTTNMPAFRNVPIRDMLSERVGKPVVFENDANVACWGEFAIGAGKDADDMVFFTLGTGIGGGIVNHGKLLEGAGDNAAELGHLIIYPDGRKCNCGQKGCVEAYASATNTANRATEAVKDGFPSTLKDVLDETGEITCKDVFEHSANGDALAYETTEETAKALALLCINMLHTTEPKQIVFAGGMIAAGDALLDRIKYYFNEHVWDLKKETVEICYATLGEDAGIIGAAALAKYSL